MRPTLADLRAQLSDLDLTEEEANARLNEAHFKLCVESEWTRANLDLGPGVGGQDLYDIPGRLYRILKFSVDGTPYELSSQEEYQNIARGYARARVPGLWWLSFTEEGDEKLAVWPTPSGGEELLAFCVVAPPVDLTGDDDTPVTPQNFDRALLNHVRANTLGDAEDDVERRDYYLGEFSRLAAELRGLRNSRAARKGARIRIRGITA